MNNVPNPIIVDADVVLNETVLDAGLQSESVLLDAEELTDTRPMPNITIGEVETLATGQPATATMTGTYAQPVLNLGLPRGEQGERGPEGPEGPQGPAGPGVPTGGSAGEVLMKNSGADLDTKWGNVIFLVKYEETRFDDTLAAYMAHLPIFLLGPNDARRLSQYVIPLLLYTVYGNTTYFIFEYVSGTEIARYKFTSTNDGKGKWSFEGVAELSNFMIKPTAEAGQTIISDGYDGWMAAPYSYVENNKLLPTGGSQGQVLKKNSSTNYDASWGSLTPSDVGAMANAYGWEDAFLQYSDGSWTAADLDLDTKLLNSEAVQVYLADTGGGTYILDESLETVAGYVLSNRNVLFLEPLNDNTEFRIWRYEFASYADYLLVLSSEFDIDDRAIIEFYPNPDDGYQTMKGTFKLQPNGRQRIPLPETPTNRDSLVYNGSAWTAKAATPLTEGIPYGECDNTSTSTAFTATVPGITELRHGTVMLLKNGVVTSASGFTININGLGAKPSYNNMAAATADTTLFNVNYTMLFIYDEKRIAGGCWVCYRGYDANTNTIGYQLRTNSSTLPMKQVTYRYRILFTSFDGQGWVPSTTSTSTNATAKRDVNQAVIDPFGEIVYYGTTASVSAGSNPSAANLWQEYTMTLGYAFNRTGAALVLPYPKPIYIKAAPQAGGGAIIDADEPYVFALPTTQDGKIYIYLGRTYSATAIEMTMRHPVYHFYNGALRLWTGPV